MGSFTQASVATVQQLASDIGVEAEAGPDGSYTFFFSHWGAFAIVPTEDGSGAILSLSRAPSRTGAGRAERLLAHAGRDERSQDFIHCALGDDGSFICAAIVEQREFDITTINRKLEQLVAVLDSVA